MWNYPGGRGINFTMTGGTDPTIGVYDFFLRDAIQPGIIVYGRYSPQGDNTAVSGLLNYNNDGWARTWSYDTVTEVWTQVVAGVSYLFTPAISPITLLGSIVFTNHVSDPLPTITDGLTTYEYFASVPIEDKTKPLYDYSTGNTWTPLIGGAPILFTMVGGTSPYGVYDFSFANSLGTLTVYARYNGGNDWETHGTFAYSGSTGFTDTWAFDIDVGTNGTMTHTYGVTPYTYEPIGALSVAYPSKTYYLGAHNDLQGLTGRLIYSDGVGGYVTDKVWHWNGSLGINMDDPTISLIATSTPTLTNIIEYDTGQDKTIGGLPYTFPINGRQYGYSGTYRPGNTELVTDLHIPLPVSSQAIDELFLGVDMGTFNNGYARGFVYETEGENDTNNAICQWILSFNLSKALLNFTELDDDDELLLSLEVSVTNIMKFGWRLLKCDKFVRNSNNQTLTVVGAENYFTGRQNWGNTGVNGRYPLDAILNVDGDTGQTAFLENEGLNRTNANLPKHTLLMTNMKYNLDNLAIIKDMFRYNEVYGGHIQDSRTDILKDTESFYTKFQLGRTDDHQLDVDASVAPYQDSNPSFQYYMRDYGKMGEDDSDVLQFTDLDGVSYFGSNVNQGNICPNMTTDSGNRQEINIYTRWKTGYNSRLIATNRFSNEMGQNQESFINNGFLYAKSISEADFKLLYPNEYEYVSTNNVGVYPYLCKNDVDGSYVLCMGFETYETSDIDNKKQLKIQDLTWFGFSPSFLDNRYITPINTDTPYLTDETPPLTGGLMGYTPNFIKEYNMNYLNLGASPVIEFDPDLNRFQFNYFHTPFRFSENTGVDADLGEEVGFLNSNTLMIMGQGISENNLMSGGNPPQLPTPIHMGMADAQAGIFIMDIYGQAPTNNFISNRTDGILLTRDNYDSTLFYTLGFSYFDIKPIKFSSDSFNNRFNPNTYNTIAGDFKALGTSPFTTNSSVNISDQTKTNIFTGVNQTRSYSGVIPFTEIPQTVAHVNQGTPAFGLGYNSLLAVSIKTTSANMTSRSVIVQLQSPFYRVYCDLPLDTMSYLTEGSLSCVGYMTKNYQSQSFIYSFASDYGGYLTRDVLLTDLRTEIRNPKGLLVNSLDPNSAVFYKVVRNIQINPGLTPEQEKKQSKQLMALQQQRAEEKTQTRVVGLDVTKYGTSTNKMTKSLGQPSGIDTIYQETQERDLFLKTVYEKYPELKVSAKHLPSILKKIKEQGGGAEKK
jgi:hypothetical protein